MPLRFAGRAVTNFSLLRRAFSTIWKDRLRLKTIYKQYFSRLSCHCCYGAPSEIKHTDNFFLGSFTWRTVFYSTPLEIVENRRRRLIDAVERVGPQDGLDLSGAGAGFGSSTVVQL